LWTKVSKRYSGDQPRPWELQRDTPSATVCC
jgi:hypothetical protein